MTWPEQLHENNNLITASGEDEFSNFLEFNMHFPDLEGHGPASHSQMQEHQHSMVHPPSNNTAPTTTTAPTATMASEARSHPQYPATMEGLTMDYNGHGPMQSHPGPMPYSTPSMTPGFCAQDPSQQPTTARQQQSQQSQQPPANQHYMQGHPMIPPTPNSIELHGNAARYPQRVEENSEMYDRYSRVNEEQVSLDSNSPRMIAHTLCKALYTPLVSPAMTPLENQFRLPEYTIPGEYFTPLTSPALEAQNANTSNNGYPFHARQVSDVGFVSTNAEVNPLPGSSAPPSPSVIRKTTRRRTSTTSRLAGRNKVKQSPSIRAQTQRNRGKPMPPNSEEFYNSLTQELNKPQNNDVRSLQASSNEGSGQDSVSPEPLSEPLMPPPALPPPRKSPAIAPQPPQTSQSPGTAATPATLMRIQRSQHAREPSNQFTGQAQLDYPDEVMEDIALPEAATPAVQPRPKMSRIDTSVRTSTASPVVSANVTPSLEPRSGPDRTPGSVAMSPRTAAMPSPSGPVPKKSEPPRSSLSSRKRPSLSSTQASPQLRPKISPSIQPLMRGGDHSEYLSICPVCFGGPCKY